MRDAPKTPTRRSKRFQPLASLVTKLSEPSGDVQWCGPEVHVRSMKPELDLFPERLAAMQDQDPEKHREYNAVFYGAFERKNHGSSSTTFRVGDTVMVPTQAVYKRDKAPSIAVIVAMWDLVLKDTDEDEKDEEEDEVASQMMVRVHWFLRPAELAAIRAKREHVENEIYYSLASSEVLMPSAISGLCSIVDQILPSINTPVTPPCTRWVYAEEKKKSLAGPFFCRVAVDSRRGLYYDFDWVDHSKRALDGEDDPWGSGDSWDLDPVEKRQGKPPRKKAKREPATRGRGRPKRSPPQRAKRVTVDGGSDEEPDDAEYIKQSDSDNDHDDDDALPVAHDNTTDSSSSDLGEDDFGEPKTPRKRRRTLAHPTPHSKAALSRRSRGAAPSSPRKRTKFAVRSNNRSLGYDSIADLPKDPWLRAMHVLHVGNRPDALPCREDEFDRVLGSVNDLLDEGSGGCIYISGVPGTGKTATVHAVVRELKRMAECNETNPFTYVEINGLRIPEPNAAYTLLWEAVSGHDSVKEGHLRIGAKESLKALTTHFSGGGGRGRGPGGHACVVLMDELDQLMTAKQDVVYNFFNWPTLVGSKLVVIAVANTMDLPERAMTGRVRSRLGMTRINFQPYTAKQLQTIVDARLESARVGQTDDAVDVLDQDAIRFTSKKVSSISGDARRILDICRRAVELVQPERRKAIIKDVQDVIKVMQNSPTAAYLRECSFHERLMLASLVKCIKREGVDEIKWGEVQYQHLTYVKVLEDPNVPRLRIPTPNELTMVLDSLVASRALLVEGGAVASRKAEGDRKIVLNLEQGEVERVLGDVGGDRWMNILGS
ncbi:P-loop containing nucleoside triphosphate hydrolase protein [Mycena sp. CBHHK59/15]|nr:P-loop containing nucleoside triphosphate hydrolase protein [Mycena sp. CBHHK59/15]